MMPDKLYTPELIGRKIKRHRQEGYIVLGVAIILMTIATVVLEANSGVLLNEPAGTPTGAEPLVFGLIAGAGAFLSSGIKSLRKLAKWKKRRQTLVTQASNSRF